MFDKVHFSGNDALNFIVSDEIHNMLGSNDSGSLGVCELTLRVDLLVCFDVVLEAS